MIFKEERIEDTNDNNIFNNATTVFKEQLGVREVKNRNGKVISVLPGIPKFTTIITIKVVLNGELDLSILQKEGYTNVKEINFKEASIGVQKIKSGLVSIINIPETVEVIKCNGNRLKTLSPLSRNIKELELQHNELNYIDFTRTPNLKKLNISYNEFQELKYLPVGLRYLNCSHNDIRFLDLKGVNELTHLYMNDNKIVSVLNIPTSSLKHIIYYNNPLKEIEELTSIPDLAIYDENGKVNIKNQTFILNNMKKHVSTDENEHTHLNNTSSDELLNYKEAIIQYFKMKKEYESNLKSRIAKIKNKTKDDKRKQKILLASLKGRCIACKRNVGTIFKKTNNNYIAICGDIGKNPCRLNIKIFNGISYNFFDDMHYFKEYTKKSMEDIIKQKMDILFNYVTEKKASVMFETELKKYTDYNTGFLILLDKYKTIYENPAKKEIIRVKTERIYAILEQIDERINEYKKNPLNKDLLKDAMEIQQRDLVHEIEMLRNIKYEQMGVTCDSVEKEKGDGLTSPPICSLFQREHNIDNFIYTVEEPKVIRFNI